jgi:hypothetical protein
MIFIMWPHHIFDSLLFSEMPVRRASGGGRRPTLADAGPAGFLDLDSLDDIGEICGSDASDDSEERTPRQSRWSLVRSFARAKPRGGWLNALRSPEKSTSSAVPLSPSPLQEQQQQQPSTHTLANGGSTSCSTSSTSTALVPTAAADAEGDDAVGEDGFDWSAIDAGDDEAGDPSHTRATASAAEGDDDDDFDQFEREAKKERARRTSLLDDLFAREWEQQQAQQHQAQHEPQHKPSQQLRASASSAAAHANARRGSQQRKSSGGTAAAAPPAARAATTALVATYRGENYRFTGPVDILDIPLAGEQPYARERFSADSAVAAAMRAKDVSYAALLQAALSGDTLSILCNMVGLRRFHIFGMVCTAWHDAIKAKMREWGVLTYVRSMGKGFGKLPGYFDMPTWLCMVPDGAWGSNVCVVDACNYRLQILSPDGTLLRTVGRPGARFGQLSSPSSVAHDPKRGGLPVVFSSSNVGPEDRRILSFDLDSWALLQSTPEGTGATQLDAPEGMAIASDTLYVVDTANHRIVAFSASTLEKVGQYPPLEWHAAGHGKRWDQLNSPHGIAAFEGELFVSDTHNDRIQVFTEALEWIGQIGQKGKGAGQFTYPKGVTVASSGSAPPLLYVCEQTRIQALSLLGEPRIIIAVPGALNLCGICTDGARVYCTDMDAHRVHVLRLTHSERWREKRREAIEEAKARRELRGGGSEGRNESDEQRKRAQERSEKERRRDRAVGAMLGGSSAHQMLGLPSSASEPELRQGIRLAMRLLHPDLAMNMTLKGTREYERIVAAFKKANNLKDIRIEAWFSGEEMK